MNRVTIAILALLIATQAYLLLRAEPKRGRAASQRAGARLAAVSGGKTSEEARSHAALLNALHTRVSRLAKQQRAAAPISPALEEDYSAKRELAVDAALAEIDAEIDFLTQLVYLLHDLGARDKRVQELAVDQALTRAEEAKHLRAAAEQQWTQARRLYEQRQNAPTPAR